MRQLLRLLWLIPILLTQTWASIAFVREGHNDANAATVQVTETLTAGNTQVVFVLIGDNAHTVSTVCDGTGTNQCTGGSTYTKLFSSTSSGNDVEIWGCLSLSTGTAFTVALSSAQVFNVVSLQYSGVVSFGHTAQGTANNTSMTVSLTTQDSNNYMAVGVACSTSATLSAPTGTIRLNNSNSNQGSVFGSSMDNTVASPGTLTTSATLSASNTWAAPAVELRTSAGGPPPGQFPRVQ